MTAGRRRSRPDPWPDRQPRTTLAGRLRRLDDVALPRAARWLRPPPGGRRPPGRRGRLAVGLVAAGAVAVAAAGVAGAARHHDDSAGAPAHPGPAAGRVTVGPRTGQPVADYLAAARSRLQAAGPGATTFALIDFTSYLSPEQAAARLAGLQVVRVFFQVPLADRRTPTHQADVRDLVPDTRRAFAAAADQAVAAAQALSLAASNTNGASPDQRRFRELYTNTSVTAGEEAGALQATCSCLIGAVVVAPVARLFGLASSPTVRIVDPAPPGVPVDRLSFVALPPQAVSSAPAPVPPYPTPDTGR